MGYFFGREQRMARRGKLLIRRIALPVVVTMMFAWLDSAHADDLFDRGARFHISASPLASALIEFSTQSGIQVAAADADVAHLNSNGVDGSMPIRTALITLLQGTDLEFSRVGAETVAIRRASLAPAVAGATLADSAAAATPTANARLPSLNAGASGQAPDVSVKAPPAPSDQELAEAGLYQFIEHHATVHFVDTSTAGNLARWRGGRQSICPLTVGLDPGYNAFVTARIRALAAYVGAPVQSDPQCKTNVQIIFSNDPQKRMDEVTQWAAVYFRNRYSGGM